MLLRDLKSIRSVQRKMKSFDLVKQLKFEFDSVSIQKPSHGMKQNLVGELHTVCIKKCGKIFWSNIRLVKLVLCITCSCI